MKKDSEKSFAPYHQRRALWDTDLSNYLFKLRHYFVLAKFAGLDYSPHQLLKAEVSTFGRVWSHVICVVSVLMSVKALVFFCVPSTVPETYVPLKLNAAGYSFRYLVPLFSVTMTILRCRTATLLTGRTYLTEIRQIVSDITRDPVLCRLRLESWKVRAHLSAMLGLTLIITVGHVSSSVSFHPDGWKSPIFYATLLEHQTYIGVALHVACCVLIVGFHIVLPLLRMAVLEFERAAKTMDIRTLDIAIRCHETSCSLIEVVDRIASFFLGAMLVIAVPQFALTISSLDKLSRNHLSLRVSATFFVWQAIFTTTFLILASRIHREAQKPQEILSSRVYKNNEFANLSSQFTKRFQAKVFGFTFFGFLTFRKRTILSVLHIITTYLIVALQIRSC